MPLNTKTFAELFTYTRGSGATRVNAAGLIVGVDFSSTSNDVGTGAKTFTLTADLSVNRDWVAGSAVRAVDQVGGATMTGTVTSYTPSTQALVINVASITGSGTGLTNWRIGSLEFRRDFDPVTLVPKGGLVEGGATNLVTNSLLAGVVAGTPGTPPTGFPLTVSGGSLATQSSNYFPGAFSVSYTATEGNRQFSTPSPSAVVGTTYCTSIRASVSTNTTLGNIFSVSGGFPSGSLIFMDGVPATAASVVNAGNIILLEAVYTATAITTQPRFGVGCDGNSAVTVTATFDSFQWEVGSRRSSYIPTTTVSVTRAADQLSVGGTNFNQFYNATQGTLLVELTPLAQAVGAVAVSLNDGTLNNAIRIAQKQSGTRSSIRKMATDGVTDVMAIAAATNTLRSNGVDYTEVPNQSGQGQLGVATSALNNFLTVGVNENFRNSTDSGLTYNARTIGGSFNGAHFGIGRFVLASTTSVINGATVGSVIVSTDGLAFRRVNISGLTQALNEVTSNGTNQYVAVGAGGVIYTSPDAEAWTAQTSGTTNVLTCAHWFGGRYVVGSNANNATRYSDNGTTWTAVTGLAANVQDVYHNGTNLWVAVGGGGIIYSSADGITWTSQTSGVAQNLNGVHFADGLWVAVGNAGTVVTSPDGTTWTDRTANSGTTQNLTEVNFFSGKFYYVGSAQVIGENTAANITANVTWTARTANVTAQLNGIATNGSRLLICGSAGAITTSDDGTTFASRTGNTVQLNGAAFGAGTYVVVGNAVNGSGLIATVNPTTFEYQRRVSNTTQQINNVRFHRGAFYGSVNTTRVVRSTDGATWTETNITGTAANLFDSADSGTLIVVVGAGGRYSTSSDGITWTATALTGATTQQLNGIDYANGLFVAVGNAGTIITSPNGTAWTLRTSGITSTLHSVMYSTRDSQWYAAGDNGEILRSADAITWTSIANDAVGAVIAGGTVQSNPVLPDLIIGQPNKVAMRIKTNDFGVSINGADAVTDVSGGLPGAVQLSVGMNGVNGQHFNAHIRKITYFPITKTDAELKGLST